MRHNVGTLDKYLRIALGLIIIAAGIIFNSYWGVLGVVPIAVAFMGVCPAYSILGVSTCKARQTDE